MAKYCVYMHKNKINGKAYVGQSCNIKVRWHPKSYSSSPYFYKAILKYGWDNFEHIILEDNLTVQEADKKEKYYIDYFNTLNRQYGYNLKQGGNNGYVLSKETKEKISLSNKKYFEKNKEKCLEHIYKMNEKTRKAVICLNTGEIFQSQMEAALFAGLKNSAPISRCCKGERKTAGKHPVTQERLEWKFYKIKKEG